MSRLLFATFLTSCSRGRDAPELAVEVLLSNLGIPERTSLLGGQVRARLRKDPREVIALAAEAWLALESRPARVAADSHGGMLSSVDYETNTVGMITTTRPGNRGNSSLRARSGVRDTMRALPVRTKSSVKSPAPSSIGTRSNFSGLREDQ